MAYDQFLRSEDKRSHMALTSFHDALHDSSKSLILPSSNSGGVSGWQIDDPPSETEKKQQTVRKRTSKLEEQELPER